MTDIAMLEDIMHAAQDHAARLHSDVELAATRMEHIRLSARANEAQLLIASINVLLLRMHVVESGQSHEPV